MLKTIARILLLAVLAYLLRDILNVILPIPTEGMVEDFIDLENDYSVLLMLRYLFWIVFLGLCFKYGRPLLSFILPITKAYSTTKPMRRFQGVFAEFFLFFAIYFLITCALAVPKSAYTYYSTYTPVRDSLRTLVSSLIFDFSEYDDRIKEIKRDAGSYVRSERGYPGHWKYNYDIPNNIWPVGDLSTAEPPANKNSQSDIRSSERYQYFVEQYKDVLTEKQLAEKERDSIYFAEKDNYNNEIAKYTEAEVEKRIGTKSEVFISAYKRSRLIGLLGAIILFVIIHFANRKVVGGVFEKLIRFLEQGRFGKGGSARFAGLFEEWATLYKNQQQGLFMGRSLYNPFLNIGLEDDRHMLTVAGSRAGKGTTAIIPNLLLWEGSALVIDPKGTNAAVTARRRSEMGQDVHLIDPFNILENETSASFNPLSLLDPDSPTIREEISIIAEALVVPDENQKEKHWDDGARTIIAGLIAQLITSPKYDNPTLPMLRDMISMDSKEQVDLWVDMSLNDGVGRLAKDAANRVIRGIGTNEISSIISNADKHTEWLSSPAINNTLSSSSFDFSELKKKPTTIYLVLPPQYLDTHNRFLRLFVNLAIGQMSKGGRSEIPVLLLMDEFLALGKMEEVEKAFGLMAGYNLVMWPFVQDMGRLKELYGNSVNAFIANSRAVQVFGVSDEQTTEFISKNIGERYISSDVKKYSGKHSVSLRDNVEVAKDIAPDTNRQYILRSGKAPLVLEKVRYYDAIPFEFINYSKGLFEGSYDPDPDYI